MAVDNGARARGGEDVKPEFALVAVVICLALMSATPALTASRQIQDYCSKQAIPANATFWHRGQSYVRLRSVDGFCNYLFRSFRNRGPVRRKLEDGRRDYKRSLRNDPY